jgi:hypothetical protein
MKLYDRFGAKGFHSSFITTFGIDFDTYENVCLNRLRGAGCTNNFILPDAGMLSHALDEASVLPRYAGRYYAAAGLSASKGGVFHSKLFLRLGRRAGELLIGSANMTSPGLAGNRELMGMVESGSEESGEREIIAAAWSYVEARLDQSQTSIARQVAWMHARTPWLADTEPAAGPVALRDGSEAAFLTAGNDAGIGRQFVGLIGERPVTRLIVMSPYWDPNLAALKYPITQLAPQETILLIEPKRRLFPIDALKDLSAIRLTDVGALDPVRFFHAKAIIAQTAQADHVLFGSANCTIAALGNASTAGINQEACLYRRLPPGTSIQSLGIERLLTDEHEIDRSMVEPPELEDDLKLSDLLLRNPGRFECIYDTLIWWPPPNAAADSVIELLHLDGRSIPASLMPIPTEPPAFRFRLSSTKDRPAFARLRHANGGMSARAIVALADVLRQEAKESRSKKAEGAAALLAEETNEGFWLLEALDVLESAEQQQAGDAKTITRKRRDTGKLETSPEQHRTLDYESFIAGRHLSSDHSALAPNGLAGSELSLVRGFLNRILGIERQDDTAAAITEDGDFSGAFDMGDETADAERAIEGGEEFPTPHSKKAKDEEEEKKIEKLKRKRRKAHADEIIGAISAFDKRICRRAAVGELSAIDVLRLRALIVVIAGAAHGGTQSAPSENRSAVQVLPVTGDTNSWSRLLGRVLFIFFGGNNPAIRGLHLDATFDALTSDIKESWATCFWTIQVCVDAAKRHRENSTFIKSLYSLAERLYAITQLHDIELTGPEITSVITAMNERYANRLGFDPGAIEKAHLSETAKLNAARVGSG